MISTILAIVTGIGPKLQAKILATFPDFTSLKNASYAQLQRVITNKTILERLWTELHSFAD